MDMKVESAPEQEPPPVNQNVFDDIDFDIDIDTATLPGPSEVGGYRDQIDSDLESVDSQSSLSGSYASDSDGSSGGPLRRDKKVSRSTARGGRADGSHCRCKCCGAVGFYTKSCGRKHRCLIGKCGDGVGIQPPPLEPPPPVGQPVPVIAEDRTLFEVRCARCSAELQFALPNHPAYIQCYACSAKMLIKPMPLNAMEETTSGLQGLSVGGESV